MSKFNNIDLNNFDRKFFNDSMKTQVLTKEEEKI